MSQQEESAFLDSTVFAELSRRSGRLRALCVYPMLLLGIPLAVFAALIAMGLQALLLDGYAFYAVGAVAGALTISACFLTGRALFRGLQRKRIASWKRDLAARYQVDESEIEELARVWSD